MENNRLTDIFLIKNPQAKQFFRIMKITVFFLFACILSLYANNSFSQNARVSMKKSNVELNTILDEIEKQTDYLFIYNSKVDTDRKVSVKANQKTVYQILSEIFNETDTHFVMEGTHIILSQSAIKEPITPESLPETVVQQKKHITGVIKDESGEPIIGASISVKGNPSLGVTTDIDGKFSLEIPAQYNTVIASFIGYVKQEINIEGKTSLEVILKEDSQILDEVVVTALGIKRSEKSLGYSVQKVGDDAITTVKGANIATSLTGKVAGLNIRTSTDFFTDPTIVLRGATPIFVIDGVLSKNVTFRELAPDDIESIEVLKGGTASALYGEKGKNGAIMITTKRGSKDGVTVSVNSNTMFHSGFLRLPQVQTSYSSGQKGVYKAYDEVWGDRLDIGRTARQWDPINQVWVDDMLLTSKGKNNLENFMETSLVTNNNVNVAYKGKIGSFRASLNHIYNKGPFPNNKENRFGFSVSGDAKISDKVVIDASLTYNKRYSPQTRGNGYGWAGYIYNMLVWTGSDYDIRDFKNYWIVGKENQEQNWHYDNWYNNPYFIAYETTYSSYHDRLFGQFSTTYTPTSWLKSIVRVGYDSYNLRDEQKYPISHRSYRKGQYTLTDGRSYSAKGDWIGLADYKFGDFTVDGLFGGGINFEETNSHSSSTKGGLSIPGFYSLAAGLEGVTASQSNHKLQTNSLYGKIGFSWRSTVFVEATGRNDWASTLSKENRSYFYPSVAGSFIVSEVIPSLPAWFKYWKLRGSWATAKATPSYNEINPTYSVNTNVWNNEGGARYPTTLRPVDLKPETQIDWEVGTEFYFLNNALKLDVAYYQRLTKDRISSTALHGATGYTAVMVNLDEERVRKGLEVTISGTPVKTKDFEWNSSFNWTKDKLYYKKIDSQYAADRLWVYDGAPINYYTMTDWERDPDGNMILTNGMPTLSKYQSIAGNMDPDWIWGFTNTFRYKDFSLLVSFDGRVGGYGWDQTSQALWHSGAAKDSDTHWRYEEVVNGVKTPYIHEGVKVVSGTVKYDSYGRILEDTRVFAKNDVAVSYNDFMKSYNAQPSGSVRSQWVNKMTFFKLREISLSYKIPKSVTQQLKINNAEVSLVGQNVLIWSKNFKNSDPDGTRETAGLITPSVRYLGFNVKFDF